MAENIPLLSVVMPAYGVERYIADAIASVQRQTVTDWELLVVDDGSPDRSGDIARRMAEGDPRITVLRKSNGGLSDARNYGLERARGRYVHFFDSDDAIEPTYYERMLACTDGADIVVSGYKTEHRDTTERICSVEEYALPDIAAVAAEELPRFINFAWNKLFLTAFLRRHALCYRRGLYVVEDCEMMARVMAHRPRIRFAQSTGYRYVDRRRTTLSKVMDTNTIAFVAQRPGYEAAILRAWGFAPEVVEQVTNRKRVRAVMGMLVTLGRSRGLSLRQRRGYVRQMAGNGALMTFRLAAGMSMTERAVGAMLKGRCHTLLALLCTLKYRR